MFEIIFIIIVIFAIKNAKKKNADGNRNNQSYGMKPPQSYSGQRQYVQPQQMQRKPVNTAAQQRRPAPAQTGPVVSKPVQPVADGADHSTTDYLEHKAMADQREHAKEKMEERKRLSEKYGGRAIAMRYLPGDRVPHGMRVVNCSYCNAENLVETIRTERACYFCRTKL